MLRTKSSCATLVLKQAPRIISTHNILNRHALASSTSKALPEYLKIVYKHVTKCINFTKARTVNHRIF